MTAEQTSSQPVVDVAFILYNYTSKLLLKKQLDFFRRATLSFSYALTVVDDASLDSSRELLATYQEVVPVFLEQYQGVGRAFNRGLASAPESRFICLLQTDVNLKADALEAVVAHCRAHPDVKVCAPVIRFPWGQPQKFVFNPNVLTLYFKGFDTYASKSAARKLTRSARPEKVAGIIGPFLFCSRELVVDSRLYDEGFQHYYCDMELAHRLFRMGVVSEVLTDCSLVRLGGQTSFIRNPETYYAMKFAYVQRCYGRMHAWLNLISEIFRVRSKVLSYRTLRMLAPSSKLTFQIQRYELFAGILKKLRGSKFVS